MSSPGKSVLIVTRYGSTVDKLCFVFSSIYSITCQGQWIQSILINIVPVPDKIGMLPARSHPSELPSHVFEIEIYFMIFPVPGPTG